MKILIKLSGKVIDNENQLTKFIEGVKKLLRNNKVVIIHGGGVQVSLWMKKLSLQPKFVDGLRVTDKDTLDVVVSILCGLINKTLVKEFINSRIKKVVGVSCVDGQLVVTDVDEKLGFVGRNIVKTNKELLDLLLKNNYLILISSVGLGIANKKFVITNINADEVSYAVGDAVKFDKVIFMTDKEGVLDKEGKLIKILKVKDIATLIKDGTVTEGMIPKLLSIKQMLKKGVSEVVITNSLDKEGTLVRK